MVKAIIKSLVVTAVIFIVCNVVAFLLIMMALSGHGFFGGILSSLTAVTAPYAMVSFAGLDGSPYSLTVYICIFGILFLYFFFKNYKQTQQIP